MNWDNITSQTACPTDGPGSNCTNPAFATANPTLCFPSDPSLTLRPEYSIKEPMHAVQYTTFALVGNTEVDVSQDTTYSIANSAIATIDPVTGKATTIAPGITTVMASWNGLYAYAQLEVVEDCATLPFTFVFLFDLSKSMGLGYGGPFFTKLDAAKHAANEFIDLIDFSKDRVVIGSFGFTGLSDFVDAANATAAHNEVAARVQTDQFTNIGGGLSDAFNFLAGDSNHKVVILLSDGENKLGSNPVTISDTFQAAGGIVMSYAIRASGGGYTLMRSIADGGFFVNSYPVDAVPNDAEDTFLTLAVHLCGVCNPSEEDVDTGSGYGNGCSPNPQLSDPNPPADVEDYPPHWSSTQSFTATCGEEEGGPLTRTATYTSYISQADADAQALAAAQALAEADLICGTVDLDGSRWEMSCTNDTTHIPNGLCPCLDPHDVVSVLSGNPMTTYNVTLRFRGMVELCAYSGGTNDGAFFQTGGAASSPGYNTYALIVSDPPQTYYLNRSHTFVGQGEPYVYAIDYNKTISVKGGATLTLQTRARDGVQLYSKDVDPGVTTPTGFAGQLVQVDVVSIT